MSADQKSEPPPKDPAASDPWGQRLIRFAVAVSLLLGPLAVAEAWARNSIDTLYPFLRGSESLADAKRLLFERTDCPDAVLLGSSLTRTSFMAETLIEVAFDPPIEHPFNFGITGNKIAVMYGAWRQVRSKGCRPNWVFVELSPPVVSRGPDRLRRFLPTVFDFAFWRDAPSGYFVNSGLGWHDLLEMQSWGGLLVSRRRKELKEAVVSMAGQSDDGRPARPVVIPDDGVTRLPSRRNLGGASYDAEKNRRKSRIEAAGYGVNFESRRMLVHLIEAAESSGAQVVLHTPPATELYHQAIRNGIPKWCQLGQEVRERFNLPDGGRGGGEGAVFWWNELSAPEYGRVHFANWNHLNRVGAEKYTRRMAFGLLTRRSPRDRLCAEYERARAAKRPPPLENLVEETEPP